MKNNKAITLIALVITIVVLIILAAVAINLSLGNNGIFGRAKTGKELYQNAEEYEKDQIGIGTNKIDDYIAGNRGTVTLTQEEYDHLVNKSAITVSYTAEIQVSSGTTYKTAFDTVESSTGSNLTLDNQGVLIGNGVRNVVVSGKARVAYGTSGNHNGIDFLKNTTSFTHVDYRIYNGSYSEFSQPPYILNVTAGDHIYMNYSGQGGKFCYQQMTVVEL